MIPLRNVFVPPSFRVTAAFTSKRPFQAVAAPDPGCNEGDLNKRKIGITPTASGKYVTPEVTKGSVVFHSKIEASFQITNNEV